MLLHGQVMEDCDVCLVSLLLALRKQAAMLRRHMWSGAEGGHRLIVSKKLRPSVQYPTRNWVLPTTT